MSRTTINHSFFFWMVRHGRIINPSKSHLKNELAVLNCKYVDCVAMAFISLYLDDSSRKIVLVFLSLIMSATLSLTHFLLFLLSFPISQKYKNKNKLFLLLLAFRFPYIKLFLQDIWCPFTESGFMYKNKIFVCVE